MCIPLHSLRVSVLNAEKELNICAFQMQCWFSVSYLNYVLSNVAVQGHTDTHTHHIHALLHFIQSENIFVVVKLPLVYCLYSDQLQSIFSAIHFTSPKKWALSRAQWAPLFMEILFELLVASHSTKTFNYVVDGKLQKVTLWHRACDLT